MNLSWIEFDIAELDNQGFKIILKEPNGILAKEDIEGLSFDMLSISLVRCQTCQLCWLALYHPGEANILECGKCGAQDSDHDYTQN